MAGLGPAIHDFTDRAKDVDGRHEGGHDETTVGQYSLKYLTRAQPDSRGSNPGILSGC